MQHHNHTHTHTLALALALALALSACDSLTPNAPPNGPGGGDPNEPPPPSGVTARVDAPAEVQWINALDEDLTVASVMAPAANLWGARAYVNPNGTIFITYMPDYDGARGAGILYALIDVNGERVAGPTRITFPNAHEINNAQFIPGPGDSALLYGTYLEPAAGRRPRVVFIAPVDARGTLGEPTIIMRERTVITAQTFDDGRIALLHVEHVWNDPTLRVTLLTPDLEHVWTSARIDGHRLTPSLMAISADQRSIYVTHASILGAAGGARVLISAFDASDGAALAPPQTAPGSNPIDTRQCEDDPENLKNEWLGAFIALPDERVLLLSTFGPACGELPTTLAITWYDPRTRSFERHEHTVPDIMRDTWPGRLYFLTGAHLTRDGSLAVLWPGYVSHFLMHFHPERPTEGWHRWMNPDAWTVPGTVGDGAILLPDILAFHEDHGYYVVGRYSGTWEVLAQRYLYVARYDHDLQPAISP